MIYPLAINNNDNLEHNFSRLFDEISKRKTLRFTKDNLMLELPEVLDKEMKGSEFLLHTGSAQNLPVYISLLGKKEDLLEYFRELIPETYESLDWFNDAEKEQFILNEGGINEIINSLKTPDFLKEKNMLMHEGLMYFGKSIENRIFIEFSLRRLQGAEEIIKDKTHDPRLYYYLGIIWFYYFTNLGRATYYFDNAVLHGTARDDIRTIVKSHYELAKLYLIKRNYDEASRHTEQALLLAPGHSGLAYINTKIKIIQNRDSAEIKEHIEMLMDDPVNMLKFIADKDFREHEITIAVLQNRNNASLSILTERLALFSKTYAVAIENGLFSCGLKAVENGLAENTFVSLWQAGKKMNELESEVELLIKKNKVAFERLDKKLAYYKYNTWKDSLNFKKLSQFADDKMALLKKQVLVKEDELDYDFTELEAETKDFDFLGSPDDDKRYQWQKLRIDWIQKNGQMTREDYVQVRKRHVKELNWQYRKESFSLNEPFEDEAMVVPFFICIVIAYIKWDSLIWLKNNSFVQNCMNLGITLVIGIIAMAILNLIIIYLIGLFVFIFRLCYRKFK